ncbi:MAG: gamma carbonic anhydrase family protein [Solobacterium sp.]|nr:gamma carbonic anhydrase family protein [Solobacterium sp.]
MTYLAEGARIKGDVTFGEDCSVWYNAVIRGDDHPIRIKDRVNIQDNCVLHASHKRDLTIGNDVTIGHGAIIHGCVIGNSCLIGMGSIIMDDAVIPDDCIVGAGALITENKTFPSGSLILGSPARAVRDLTEEEKASIIASSLHYVHAAREQLSSVK